MLSPPVAVKKRRGFSLSSCPQLSTCLVYRLLRIHALKKCPRSTLSGQSVTRFLYPRGRLHHSLSLKSCDWYSLYSHIPNSISMQTVLCSFSPLLAAGFELSGYHLVAGEREGSSGCGSDEVCGASPVEPTHAFFSPYLLIQHAQGLWGLTYNTHTHTFFSSCLLIHLQIWCRQDFIQWMLMPRDASSEDLRGAHIFADVHKS